MKVHRGRPGLPDVRLGLRPATWAVVELLATVVAQLALTPLLLTRMEATHFAAWVLAQSALMASVTLSLGTSAALLPVVAAAWAQRDHTRAWAAIGLFLGRTWRTAATALLVLLPMAAVLETANPAVAGSIYLTVVVGATLLWLSATEFDNGLSSALKAAGRFDAVAIAEATARTVQVLATALFVAAGTAAEVPIVVAAATTAAKAVAKFLILRRQQPLPAQLGASATGLARELGAAGAWLWLGMLGGIAFYAFDRWFVGAVLGAAVLATYAVCSQIAQLPHAIVSAAAQVLVPWAAALREGLGDAAACRKIRTAMVLSTLLAMLPSLVLLYFLEPLVGGWIGQGFAQAHLPLARELALVSLVLSLNVPSYFLLFGLGRVRETTLLALAASIVFVAGSLFLMPPLQGFVALRGVFAVISLGMVVQLLRVTHRVAD